LASKKGNWGHGRGKGTGNWGRDDINLPVANVRRIILKGAENRAKVGEKTTKELIKILNEVGTEIAKDALEIARSSPFFTGATEDLNATVSRSMRREYITAEDVAIAARRVLSQDLQ